MNDDRDFISSDDSNSISDDVDSLFGKDENDAQSYISVDQLSADEFFEGGFLDLNLSDYKDDSIILCRFMKGKWTCAQENDYRRELLEWESSAIKPVIEWLDSKPRLVDPQKLSDQEASVALYELCAKLNKINLRFLHTDHLSDRCLYGLIVSKILPCPIKRLPHCVPAPWEFCYYLEKDGKGRFSNYDFVWLTYYATDAERGRWKRLNGGKLPPHIDPPHKRKNSPFQEKI